jgi:hypothetical protein
MKRLILAATGLAVLCAATLFPASAVHANGVPQLVKLTYLQGVSNYGPEDAEGVLEFSFAEAYARVDVKNLKQPDGYTFEGWLVGGGGEPLLVGEIPVNSAGVGAMETKLDKLTRYDYNQFVVAARGPASPPGTLPAQKSIAGRFTVIQDSGTATPGDVRPATLPDTGQAEPPSTMDRLGRVVMVVGVGSGVAIIVLAYLRRRARS